MDSLVVVLHTHKRKYRHGSKRTQYVGELVDLA